MVVRKVQLDGHQTDEAWVNGAWRAFDSDPETRWVYDSGDRHPPITFKWLRDHGEQLVRRVNALTGWDIWWAIKKASCEPFPKLDHPNTRWQFRYDLRPAESITMYFDMRERVEMKSRAYAEAGFNRQSPEHRNPCDYGSAVFDYRPDFSDTVHKPFATVEKNVRWTKDGLIPEAPPRTPSTHCISRPFFLAGCRCTDRSGFQDRGDRQHRLQSGCQRHGLHLEHRLDSTLRGSRGIRDGEH